MAKLLKNLPIGAKVKDCLTKYNGRPILFTIMEHNHAGDPNNSTALITSNIITLKCFDDYEPENSNLERKKYGNNRYLYSNIKQWLNSDKAAGKWYVAQHSADSGPNSINLGVYGRGNVNKYEEEAGFLTNFSEKMKAELLDVTKIVLKNNITDGGGYENVTQKVFLLSMEEVGITFKGKSSKEGSIYEFFAENRYNAQAEVTKEVMDKLTYKEENLEGNNKRWYWWLRTPDERKAEDVSCVSPLGYHSKEHACSGRWGIRPACVVSSSILVSDTADTDGAYTIIWNEPPAINTDSDNLGDKNAPFNLQYKITDANNEKVTAKVTLDEEVVQTLDNVVLGYEYKVSISSTKINSLSVGSHTFTIWAKDSYGNESTKTVTFNKVNSSIAISGVDSNVGNKWQPFNVTYQVNDSEFKSITITEYIDDEAVRTIEEAPQSENIAFDLSSFDTLENEKTHKLTIKAVNSDGAESYRYIEFVKLYKELKFEIKAVENDAPAKKIMVNLDYDKTGEPEVMVEVTNCAYNAKVVWEDATEAFKNREVYHFTNEVFDDKRYGVSVRITVMKNSSTERVYVFAIGYNFD